MIFLTSFGTYLVQNRQNNHNLDPKIPFQTDIDKYCSEYRYSEILIFIFGAFQNRYGNFFFKIDTIYWFIAQH